MEAEITKAQIVKIKIAQKQLGIDEETKLEQYAFYKVNSCTQLNYEQAEGLLESYKRAGFKVVAKDKGENNNPNGWGSAKYKDLDKRGNLYARSSMLRKIEALWKDVSRTKTDESLRVFIKNKTGIDHITFLDHHDAGIIITALEQMKTRNQKQKDAQRTK